MIPVPAEVEKNLKIVAVFDFFILLFVYAKQHHVFVGQAENLRIPDLLIKSKIPVSISCYISST